MENTDGDSVDISFRVENEEGIVKSKKSKKKKSKRRGQDSVEGKTFSYARRLSVLHRDGSGSIYDIQPYQHFDFPAYSPLFLSHKL